jgi:hypothetical protein
MLTLSKIQYCNAICSDISSDVLEIIIFRDIEFQP